MEEDKIIIESFSKEQIHDFKIILKFYDESICKSANETELMKCYDIYLDELKNRSIQTGDFSLNIDYDEQKLMYKNINKTTFDNIWKMGNGKNAKKEPIDVLLFNLESSSYLSFLKKLHEKDAKWTNYYNWLRDNGVITPPMISTLLTAYNEVNLNDEKIRLVFAIHYLTINDNHNRGA